MKFVDGVRRGCEERVAALVVIEMRNREGGKCE
jgi:hypothetical protein